MRVHTHRDQERLYVFTCLFIYVARYSSQKKEKKSSKKNMSELLTIFISSSKYMFELLTIFGWAIVGEPLWSPHIRVSA